MPSQAKIMLLSVHLQPRPWPFLPISGPPHGGPDRSRAGPKSIANSFTGQTVDNLLRPMISPAHGRTLATPSHGRSMAKHMARPWTENGQPSACLCNGQPSLPIANLDHDGSMASQAHGLHMASPAQHMAAEWTA
jgi:hypothetical protein